MPGSKEKSPRTAPRSAGGKSANAEFIRQAAKASGTSFRPRDIVAALKDWRVVVTCGQVRKALTSSGFCRNRRGAEAATASSPADSGAMSKAE
jgi:hypothetical protein